ncbi:MAG: hypothetical protein HYU66_04495, partial [Armatimonadetes bacterium]|nr:hypothetical protein [Armatimonadota bacterium]
MAQRFPAAAARSASRPTLGWPARDDRLVTFTDEDGGVRRVPRARLAHHGLREVDRRGDGRELLIHGENHHALSALLGSGHAGTVKLVYIDPPFCYARRFQHYDDVFDPGVYLAMLRDRLVLLRELLAADGSLVVHLDDRAVHHVRLLLDEIFGSENFRNSLIVKRVTKNLQRQFDEVFALPQAHDVCLLYSRNPTTRYRPPLLDKPDGARYPEGYWKEFWSTANRPTMRYDLLGVTPEKGQWKWCRERAVRAVGNHRRYEAEAGGRSLLDFWRDEGSGLEFIRRSPTGRVQHWVPPSDTLFADTLWTDFSAYAHRQGFPTEKSERLLARLLTLFTQPG